MYTLTLEKMSTLGLRTKVVLLFINGRSIQNISSISQVSNIFVNTIVSLFLCSVSEIIGAIRMTIKLDLETNNEKIIFTCYTSLATSIIIQRQIKKIEGVLPKTRLTKFLFVWFIIFGKSEWCVVYGVHRPETNQC